MRFNLKTLKICLVILCLLPIQAVGTPQFIGATFFMKEIQLTQGKIALVDDEDFEYLNQWKWKAQKTKSGNWYANRVQYTPDKRIILMHRLILNLSDSKVWCDHKDHNGLNNQKNNLRNCNRSQNTANKRPIKNKTSNFLGVCLYKNKWRAGLKYQGKAIHLGDFEKEQDAALAYNNGALKYHGEFTNLNKL